MRAVRGIAVSVTGITENVNRIASPLAGLYDTQGNVYQMTAFADTGGLTLVNQLENVYNGLGQLTGAYQADSGAVTTTGPTPTPETQYAYSDPSTGSLMTALFYPNGREISLSYGDYGSLSDSIGWVSSIADANSMGAYTLATYTYLGNGAMVGQYRPQTGANEGITLDDFGNIGDLNWSDSSAVSTDHFGFGYDVNGNVLYKRNYVNDADSELYHANGTTPGYDDLNRLTAFARGTLSASVTDSTLDTISSPATTQSWALDAVGNQTAVTTDGTTQSKSQNAQNQTTSVGGSGLAYDANKYWPTSYAVRRASPTAGSAPRPHTMPTAGR
jgi:hypothetical protein